ncbi:MAG: UDP-N-acetylmuramoyl-L-alanyl-D-glutamate--2,6-diaminopimelate ligase [Planctomycetales bacterium 4572_13]|nr:MAG: UDP-N-acetylmuramoyl-L-alanyl-D-glutamate--2,6-diaminopimelate ligase [Planctomycetales bacterium 4572_13]
MTLTQLLALVQSEKLRICSDSRQIQPGDVFVAVCGTQVNGHDYIDKALAGGAAHIVTQRPVEGVDCIIAEDTAKVLGQLAQTAMGNPAAKLTNLAVTGTNGKTTVAYMVRSILEYTGAKCGLIGTIEYNTGRAVIPAPLTTPDAVTLAAAAQEMVLDGASYMVIEASSHALSQKRLAGISFTAAAFTNLTGDHLDYHKTEDDYLDAKTLLFTDLPPHGLAVLNAESDAAHTIAEIIEPATRLLWYGIDRPVDINAEVHRMDATGSEFSIIFENHSEKVTTHIPGRHNILNCLTAAGLCLGAGIGLSDIAAGLSALQAVPGRLQPVLSAAADQRGIRVFVDYAHTDDALVNVLKTLKPLCEGRLIVLFGCGGDRDKTKRPRMAAAAEELADIVIVTSDNPRTEDPDAIIEDITQGFTTKRGQTPFIESDRVKAIQLAVQQAKAGDIVLLAGKGHEDYQIIGTEKRHFSDFEEALKAI